MVTSWKGDAMLSEFHMFPNAEKVLLEFLASGKHPLVKRSEGNYFWAIGEDDRLYSLMATFNLLGRNTDGRHRRFPRIAHR